LILVKSASESFDRAALFVIAAAKLTIHGFL